MGRISIRVVCEPISLKRRLHPSNEATDRLSNRHIFIAQVFCSRWIRSRIVGLVHGFYCSFIYSFRGEKCSSVLDHRSSNWRTVEICLHRIHPDSPNAAVVLPLHIWRCQAVLLRRRPLWNLQNCRRNLAVQFCEKSFRSMQESSREKGPNMPLGARGH